MKKNKRQKLTLSVDRYMKYYIAWWERENSIWNRAIKQLKITKDSSWEIKERTINDKILMAVETGETYQACSAKAIFCGSYAWVLWYALWCSGSYTLVLLVICFGALGHMLWCCALHMLYLVLSANEKGVKCMQAGSGAVDNDAHTKY